jgi:DNA-binding MarR family transcriptional regulator
MPSVPPAALEAAHLIDRLDRLVRGGESAELNPAQWEALRYLARANRFSRTPAALAEYFGSTRGTASQTLIALETKGFVTRTKSERDGRSLAVALTALGTRTLRKDPIDALAAQLAEAAGTGVEQLAIVLRETLRSLVVRNGHRPFGACHACRHFRAAGGDHPAMPHRCALLDEPLSAADSAAICVEQEPAAGPA